MKKIISLTLPVFVLSLLTFQSCFKEQISLDPIENDQINDVFGFRLNGEIWNPRCLSIYSSKLYYHYSEERFNTFPDKHNFIISGNRCEDGQYFDISARFIDVGELSNFEGSFTEFDSTKCGDYAVYLIDTTYVDNLLNIIEIDTTLDAVAGYFEFRAIDTMCVDTILITDGRFRLGFQ